MDDTIPATVLDFMHVAMTVIGPVSVTIYLNFWIAIPFVFILALMYVRTSLLFEDKLGIKKNKWHCIIALYLLAC